MNGARGLQSRSAVAWVLVALLISTGVQAGTTVVDAKGHAIEIQNSSRIISVGGTLTEIVYAVGVDERLVGADTTSVWPEAARDLPKVGYQRALSAERVLSLKPTLVLATIHAGPPAVMDQLRAAGVTLLIVNGDPTVKAARQRIESVARALDRAQVGEAIVKCLSVGLDVLQQQLAIVNKKPRVLYLAAHGQRTPLAAGRETAADAIVQLAGGKNAVTGYSGYQPLTPEAAVAAQPDVILVSEQEAERLGGIETLRQTPGLALTPAGKNRRVVSMDGLYLLGFGPRLGAAAHDLAAALHPATKLATRD